jgi:hypothetical protein
MWPPNRLFFETSRGTDADAKYHRRYRGRPTAKGDQNMSGFPAPSRESCSRPAVNALSLAMIETVVAALRQAADENRREPCADKRRSESVHRVVVDNRDGLVSP